MKVNSEMNTKYNSYDHLDRLKCIENDEIINIEKKFEAFSIDINYDYAKIMLENKEVLPNVNIDLSKVIAFYKSRNDSLDDLVKEITLFNKYYESLTKWVNLTKTESLKEKSIVYYLFYFMSRCFIYIVMHNNFMVSKPNTIIFLNFFNNYIQIINTAKLYLENDIENSSIIIEEEDKETTETKIKTNVNKGLYAAFAELKNYPEEFKDMIMRCHNFLALVLFSIDQSVPPENEEDEETVNIIDEDMLKILEIFVPALNIFHEVNENYSIVNYKVFYNDGISKSLNIKREFYNYLNNEKIKKRQKKEQEKAKEKEKGKKEEDEKDKQEKNNDNIIIMDEDKDEEKEEEKLEKKNDKLKFTLFDYMWIFNPAAKNDIIRLFNMEQQKNMFFKMIDDSRRERDDLGFLDIFLNRNKFNLMLNIRRDHLIEDTLNELSKPNVNLQSELKVKFSGEQGVDEGGVRKEFFILLIRQIFDPNYGMFSYNKKTRLYWFNHYSFEPKIKYELIGKIFGLAIYNNTILDVKLPIVVYKKLLGIKPNLDDMKECDPELYHTLNYLVNNNDPNLKEELDTNFTVIDDKFGEKLVIPLKPNGENILIDINNKNEYVELYLDWYFNKSIQEYFNSFEKGFYCPKY